MCVCVRRRRARADGFIALEGEDRDVFVHQSDIYAPGFRSLAEGEPVEFRLTSDPKTGKMCARAAGPRRPAPPARFLSPKRRRSTARAASARPRRALARATPPPLLSVRRACAPLERSKAVDVTGPDGAYVQGAPREPRYDYDDDY